MINVSTDLNISSCVVDNRVDIPYLGYFFLDTDTVGRLDIICIKAYGSIDYLPLLLDFNNITDISSTEIGDLIIVPDFNIILKDYELNNILNQGDFDNSSDDTEVPGVSKYDNAQLIDSAMSGSEDSLYQMNMTAGSNVANSGNLKLGIVSNPVSYDSTTETLRF